MKSVRNPIISLIGLAVAMLLFFCGEMKEVIIWFFEK